MSQSAVEHLNPDSLHKNPAFTQAIVVTQPARTIYVGGQDAVDAAGNIVGKGDLAAQTEQVLSNLRTALQAAGAEMKHIIKWNLYVVHGQDLRPGLEAFQRAWGRNSNPPVITMCFVPALANPDFLVEMDAIAVMP